MGAAEPFGERLVADAEIRPEFLYCDVSGDIVIAQLERSGECFVLFVGHAGVVRPSVPEGRDASTVGVASEVLKDFVRSCDRTAIGCHNPEFPATRRSVEVNERDTFGEESPENPASVTLPRHAISCPMFLLPEAFDRGDARRRPQRGVDGAVRISLDHQEGVVVGAGDGRFEFDRRIGHALEQLDECEPRGGEFGPSGARVGGR